MYKGQNFSKALPSEPPPGLCHELVAELAIPEDLYLHFNNFVIVFHEMQHLKTQSLFRNGY